MSTKLEEDPVSAALRASGPRLNAGIIHWRHVMPDPHGQSPVWSIRFPENETWAEAHAQREGGEYLIEYTQGGEKVEAWTQLVTLAYQKTTKESFPSVMNYVFSRLQENCPSFRAGIIEQHATKFIFHWSHDGCGGFSPRESVARYEYVAEGILSVLYERLKTRDAPGLDAWAQTIVGAEVVSSAGA